MRLSHLAATGRAQELGVAEVPRGVVCIARDGVFPRLQRLARAAQIRQGCCQVCSRLVAPRLELQGMLEITDGVTHGTLLLPQPSALPVGIGEAFVPL